MNILCNGGYLGKEALCYQMREIMKQLSKKHDIKIDSVPIEGYWGSYFGEFKNGKEHDIYLMNGHVPHLKEIAKKRKKIISICVFETTLPSAWKDALNIPEVVEVWTVSEFCKQLIIESGVKKPVRVIYLGVDDRIFPTKADMFPKDESFKFLNISAPHGIGKKDRKGLDILVKAFKEEFGDDPKVTLILKVNTIYADKYAQSKGTTFNIYKYIKSLLPGGTKLNNIAIIQNYLNYDYLNMLYNSVQCGVFPARAEGFGFCQAELIKVGKPVITTDYSATNEYSDERLRIEILGMYPLDSNVFPYFNSLFAEPDKKSLKSLMRSVYDNYDTEKDWAETFSKRMEKFTWDNVGKRMNNFLQKNI